MLSDRQLIQSPGTRPKISFALGQPTAGKLSQGGLCALIGQPALDLLAGALDPLPAFFVRSPSKTQALASDRYLGAPGAIRARIDAAFLISSSFRHFLILSIDR